MREQVSFLFITYCIFGVLCDNVQQFAGSTEVLRWASSVAQSSSAHYRHLDNGDADKTKQRFDNSSQTPRLLNQKKIQSYVLWSSELIHETLNLWANHYANLVTVTTAQATYGLPAAGGSEDCPFDEGQDGCFNYILTIQDYVAHPEGSESAKRLPTVLLSGEVHGNEQVGPTAVLETAQLLLDAASCEVLPRIALKGTPGWEQEVINAESCRQDFLDIGIAESDRIWLARLVSTRRIVIIPTANALGYFQTMREENGVDPNRDFPYDLTDPGTCMVTIAARTLNEVYREHLIQLALTFHGGMEVVGYEWGAPSWAGKASPDDIAQSDIAAAYSFYGGGWKGTRAYMFGNMNDLVYPVRGGMEDWAYAGSWDKDRVIQCQPETYGGYAPEKTTYGPSTLRVFNMLVESSDRKIPPASALGTSENLLNHASAGNGYVSRNIRVSLLATELVEPYVSFTEVNELRLSDDVVPLTSRGNQSCQSTKLVAVPYNSLRVVLQWIVGGAMTIDGTELWYGLWNDIPEHSLDCIMQPDINVLRKVMKNGTIVSSSTGTGRFAPSGASPPFIGSIDISGYKDGDRIVVVALARVDQGWAQKPENKIIGPDLYPQSHIVNARTNSSWHHENAGMIVQGRVDWFSIPLTILLEKRISSNSIADVQAVELSNRFENYSSDYSIPGENAEAPSTESKPEKNMITFTAVVVVLGILLCLGCACNLYLRHRMRVARRSQLRDFIEDERAPSPGLRHKANKRNGYGHVDYSDLPELELGELN